MVSTPNDMRKRRAEGIEITLPEFGDVIKIRPLDVGFFVRAGRIPDFLASTVNKMLSNQPAPVPNPPDDPEKMADWLTWLDEMVMWAVVEPKVVKEVKDPTTELSIDEFTYPDKLWLYQWFGRPAVLLRSFRVQQTRNVAVVDGTKEPGDTAVKSDENPTVGK